MHPVLTWCQDHGSFFYGLGGLAWIVLLIVIAVSFLAENIGKLSSPLYISTEQSRLGRWSRPEVFIIAAILAIWAFRWPILWSGPLPNPDETQLGAGAITYLRDPVPWRSVDMHTSGPLNAYILWLFFPLPGGFDYWGLHAASLFLHVVTALGVYGFMRAFTSPAQARCASLPLIAFYAFCINPEVVQYSSEQLSVALLSVAGWILARTFYHQNSSGRAELALLGTGGFVLGCVPWAKPQLVPLGLLMGIAGVAGIFIRPSPRPRTVRLLGLSAGAVLPTFLFLGALALYGLLPQFHTAYILSNQAYTSGYNEGRAQLMHDFVPEFIGSIPALPSYFWSLLVTGLLAAGCVGLFRLKPRGPLVLAWALLVVAVWCILYPGRTFPHYLQLILVPMAWVGGLSFLALQQEAVTHFPRAAPRTKLLLSLTFVAVTLGPIFASRVEDATPLVGPLVAQHNNSRQAVSSRILELKNPGDTLLVWGWMPALNVETGLPQGSREGHTTREIQDSALGEFYRERFLRDLRRRPPRFIVDAVCDAAPMYHDRKNAGPQALPEFQKYLADHYFPPEQINDFLLYLRRESPKKVSSNR